MSMVGWYLALSASELEAVISDPESVESLFDAALEESSADIMDIDKTWHLIHFLLNGSASVGEGPLGNAVLGGLELEGTDSGYGPFRYLRVSEVRETALALSHVSSDDLWSRFDRAEVEAADIYPEGWTGEDEDRRYVASNYSSLQLFMSQAAASSKAVILCLL